MEAVFALRDWKGLWLSGGTCLAEYYFGHRTSINVDLFTGDDGLFRDARSALGRSEAFARLGEMEALRTDLGFCQFLLRLRNGGTVKVDLVRDPPVVLGDKVSCGAVWLDSLPDLASNKMGCLLHREDPKDYVDLYYLLPHLGLDTEAALASGLEKDGGLDPLVLAEQLRFIQTVARPEFLRSDIPWANVQDFFRRMRADLLRLIEPRES